MNAPVQLASGQTWVASQLPSTVYAVSCRADFADELKGLFAASHVAVRHVRAVQTVDGMSDFDVSALFVCMDYVDNFSGTINTLQRLRRSYYTPVVIVSSGFRGDDFSTTRRPIADVSLAQPLTHARVLIAAQEALQRSHSLQGWYDELATLRQSF